MTPSNIPLIEFSFLILTSTSTALGQFATFTETASSQFFPVSSRRSFSSLGFPFKWSTQSNTQSLLTVSLFPKFSSTVRTYVSIPSLPPFATYNIQTRMTILNTQFALYLSKLTTLVGQFQRSSEQTFYTLFSRFIVLSFLLSTTFAASSVLATTFSDEGP